MDLAKTILSSIARTPRWPAGDLIQESWMPIMPHEMPREAPTFYFSSSGLRSAALKTIQKHKEIVAGSAFDEIISVCGEFLREVLWPQDYRKISTAKETLSDAYQSDEELQDVEVRFEDFLRSKFTVTLYMAPVRCDGVNGHVVPPQVDSSDKTEAWISTPEELDRFLSDQFALNVSIDLAKFPPEQKGYETFEATDTIGLSWFVVFARNEQVAISKLMMLLGAVCVALAPRSLPNRSDAKFGGVAHIGHSNYGFGAFYRVQLPTIFGNAEITEERTDTHLEIQFHTNFELSVVEKLTALEDTIEHARIRRAVYFLGLAFRSEVIATYMFFASALDALFNHDGCSLTKAATLGLEKFSGDADAKRKIEWLLAIRGRLAHGSAQTPQEASKYLKFWRRFDQEPLDGFWLLLRNSIVKILEDIPHYETELERIKTELEQINNAVSDQ